MARDLFDYNDSKWESLEGALPFASLDTHPSGEFIAMQILLPHSVASTERAAVWNTKTHKIYWNPGNANALCWIEGGSEILVLEESPKKGYIRPALYVTPTQEEYHHFMRRLSWPGLENISYIKLEFPQGWLTDVIASPMNSIACFVWEDQCEVGIEFVSWKEGELRQLANTGFYERGSNKIQGPVFSPDGTILAMTFGAGCWWSEEPDMPSIGGEFNVGWLVWSEAASGKYERIAINTSVPSGWRPDNPEDMLHNEFLSKPEFIGLHEVKITLPTGEERILFIA